MIRSKASNPRWNEPMKTTRTPSRDAIIQAIVGALEPLDYVYAMWEGGAAAFGRLDEWSDIDICVDAEDRRVKDTFPVVEQALESLSPIELKYEILEPTLGDYVQAFYRLKGTSEFMLIDFAVFKHSAPDKLLVPEIHGEAVFHFNKEGALKCPSLDREKLMSKLKARVKRIQERLQTFRCFIPKELNRGNQIEALNLYYRFILGSLVEVLRMTHKPARHDFGTRYVRHDLPAEVVARLRELYFVKDRADLETKYRIAEAWLDEVIGQIDFGRIERAMKNS